METDHHATPTRVDLADSPSRLDRISEHGRRTPLSFFEQVPENMIPIFSTHNGGRLRRDTFDFTVTPSISLSQERAVEGLVANVMDRCAEQLKYMRKPVSYQDLYAYFDTHRQPPPQQVPKQTGRGARQQAAPTAEQLDCSRPSSSDLVSLPPHMFSDGPYPHRFASSPTQTAISISPSSHPAPFERMPRPKSQRDSPVYSVHPESESRGDQPRDRPFDPQHSRNPFINGSLAYRFVWGDPLCVRCGYTGHLPKQCTAEALTYMEQSYLYRLMRKPDTQEITERARLQQEFTKSQTFTSVTET